MTLATAGTRTVGPARVVVGGICGLVLTLGLARFAYTPLLPLMHAQAGVGDRLGGWLAALNYAGYMSGAVFTAAVDAPRWRHRFYGAALWLSVAVVAAMGCTTSPWVWALLRYLAGLCSAAGLLMGSGLMLRWRVSVGRRPELGLHLSGLGIGIAVSALGVMLLSHWSLRWDAEWWAFGGLGAALWVPAWAWRPPMTEGTPPRAPPDAAATITASPSRRWAAVLTAAYFCAGWGFVIGATYTVTAIERQSALAGHGPLAWLLVGAAAAPSVFLWDRLARRVGDIGALLAAFTVQTVAFALPAASTGLWAALAGAALYGGSFVGIVALTLALVGRRSPANPGKAMARLTLSYGVAQVIAPALSGAMAQANGGSYVGPLWLTAAVLGLGCGLVGWLCRTAPAGRSNGRG